MGKWNHPATLQESPSKKKGHFKKRNGYFYLLPALGLIIVFSYLPFIKTVALSFFTINSKIGRAHV